MASTDTSGTDATGLNLSASTNLANSAKDLGTSSINNYDPTAAATNATNLANSNYNTAQTENNSMVTQYANAVKANPTVTDLYNQGNALFNVPQLGQNATNLSNQVNNTVPDSYQGARGFDIGNAQVENGQAAKLAYLQPQSNAATANYNQASTLANQYVQAGQAQNTQNLAPTVAGVTQQAANMAAQATGWNTALSSQLTGLIDKMNNGVTLSQAEMTQAGVLAQQETAYQDQVLQNSQAANTATKTLAGTMYTANHQNIAQGGTSFNTNTGSYYTPGVGSGTIAGVKPTA
jgi:hypothetical protein